MKEGDFPADTAGDLGQCLSIKQGIMSNLRQKSGGDPDRLLTLVIKQWLNNDSEKSWLKLADALEQCNLQLIANKISKWNGLNVYSFHSVGIEDF